MNELEKSVLLNPIGKRNRGHNYCKRCGKWILGGFEKPDNRIDHLKNWHGIKVKGITNTQIGEHFSKEPVLIPNPIVIPMKAKHIDLMLQGRKESTLRSLKHKYPLSIPVMFSDGQRQIWAYLLSWWEKTVPDDLTPEIVKTEGYENTEELLAELRSMRHKLPKTMILYYFKLLEATT